MTELTCGFIGLGLIGGSIARALKEKKKDSVRILAFDPNPDTLELALSQQVADQALEKIDSNLQQCDYVFLCAPVAQNAENLIHLKQYLSKNCILTDVGSVKSDICSQIEAAGLDSCFIGGHPMAGSERTGFANSKARLLENAYYILTPSATVPESQVQSFQSLIQALGAIPLVLTPKQHDYVTGAVSHLPHVIAASLVNLIEKSDTSDGIMKMIAAGGFKDITRIASSAPEMWQQICLANSENISELLGCYISDLLTVKEMLDDKNSLALNAFFTEARTYRDSFMDAARGPIKKSYVLTVDIADRPGAIATIATLLAAQNISIKNIGITHNREVQEGALRIEFHEESSIGLAKTLLASEGYTSYEKN